MIKALNPESLDLTDIENYVKRDRNSRYLTGEALERAIARELEKRKQENLEYKMLLFLTIFLLLTSAVGAIVTIINIFKGHWNYVVGFAILTYAAFWVFRRIPWPMSRMERSAATLRSILGRR